MPEAADTRSGSFPPRLYLVRHGRAAAGVDALDPGLDDMGRAQARAAAEALRASGASRLVVSPLRRTRETAEPIAEALGLAVEIDESVAEVFDPSLPVEARRNMIGPLLAGRWIEQNEALRGFRDRVLESLLGLANETTVVVSHFVAIGVAVGAALGDDRVVPAPIANGSITRLAAGGGNLKLEAAGDVRHLTREQVTGTHAALAGRRAPSQ